MAYFKVSFKRERWILFVYRASLPVILPPLWVCESRRTWWAASVVAPVSWRNSGTPCPCSHAGPGCRPRTTGFPREGRPPCVAARRSGRTCPEHRGRHRLYQLLVFHRTGSGSKNMAKKVGSSTIFTNITKFYIYLAKRFNNLYTFIMRICLHHFFTWLYDNTTTKVIQF